MLKSLKSHYAESTIAQIKARQADLGTIHAAKDQLKMSESDYRALVKASCSDRVDSSAEMIARERARLIRALKAKGYVSSEVVSERTIKAKANRLHDLGVIHMGKRELGLGETEYRKLVSSASGKVASSSGLLGAPQRAMVIAALCERGFDPKKAEEKT